jgi:hypothetical protein
LYFAGQGAEVGHTLEFIVRKLDMKMILELGQKIERLQAVDAKRFEKVIVGGEFLSRYFEVGGR